ncbi:MAG TPA: hypothetical protein VJ815_02965 [Acidimicrobiia bacterium]|jgi:hypothetical protein|nr:hypothetical protein [Acidimicrobiia bacterium]
MSTQAADGRQGEYIVEALLLPPGASDEGLAIGVDSGGNRIVAWGSRTALDTRPTRSLPVVHQDCVACALTIPAAAIASVFTTPGRVKVMAQGILGDLALHFLDPKPGAVRDTSKLDLIVLDGDEPSEWPPAMARLRAEGTLVALMSPRLTAPVFDFYPQVHARSLTLVPLPWYLPPLNPKGDFAGWHAGASHVSRQLLPKTADASGWVWLTELDSHLRKAPDRKPI